MGKIAFVFPGQGAQAVGMGKDAYEAFDSARSIFDRADEALGFNLSEIIFQGPEEVLKQTDNTQPALLTVSIALLEAFKDRGIKPDYVAGHSLGEYSALVAAGVLILRGCGTHGACSRSIHGAGRSERTRSYGSRAWSGA